jgi:hypothetical protein
VFLALLQDSYLSSTGEVQLRTKGDAALMTQTVRRAIADVDGRVDVEPVRSLRNQVLATFAPERTAARFFVGFAVLALFVAAIGLYGTVSYGLERRTSEIGLRIALGAAHRDVVWLVASASLIRLASGLLVGGCWPAQPGRWYRRSSSVWRRMTRSPYWLLRDIVSRRRSRDRTPVGPPMRIDPMIRVVAHRRHY